MDKIGKIMGLAIVSLLIALAVLLAIWAIMSPGTIRRYDGEKSLSEKFVIDINGLPNGFFINSTNTDNPVLLFVSSGPGTDDYMFTEKYKDMKLEDEFTVVYWDYRGMGIAYCKDIDTEQITLRNILDDTQAVTEYLKERFSKKRIYIMGFSGGTHIALRAAAEHPENYSALINMAQCVTDSCERDTLMYTFMKNVFSGRKDTRSLQKLEAAVEPLENGMVACKNWYEYVYLLHYAGGGTVLNKSELTGITLPIIFCKCYTLKEKINYVRGMKMYRTTAFSRELEGFDYRRSIAELKLPAYFISGDTDYNCPWELVQEYCDILKAPDKEFYLIPHSAHSPLWENPSYTCAIMKQIKDKTDR